MRLQTNPVMIFYEVYYNKDVLTAIIACCWTCPTQRSNFKIGSATIFGKVLAIFLFQPSTLLPPIFFCVFGVFHFRLHRMAQLVVLLVKSFALP
mmetsp:Transcript_34753/g.51859  ORF Transcript_34753/g.51859 Transcript_34753/m.51859 type:complete len:94 (-) Transcript_34753:507-788(-)